MNHWDDLWRYMMRTGRLTGGYSCRHEFVPLPSAHKIYTPPMVVTTQLSGGILTCLNVEIAPRGDLPD